MFHLTCPKYSIIPYQEKEQIQKGKGRQKIYWLRLYNFLLKKTHINFYSCKAIVIHQVKGHLHCSNCGDGAGLQVLC